MFGMTMRRAVMQNEKCVEFVNGVGGMVGQHYKYRCDSVSEAVRFAAYCNQRDPNDPTMPIAVTAEIAKTFGAVKDE